MKKILLCFGTRPEYLKLKPLIKLLSKSEYEIFYTGQQDDLIKNLEVKYKSKIENKINRLNDILISCLENFPKIDFDSIIVQGDTASALGCALAAFKAEVPLLTAIQSFNLKVSLT